MHGDHVGPLEELREADLVRPGLRHLLGGQVRVIGQHLHLEGERPSADLLADLPQADDSQHPAPQLRPQEVAALPLPAPDRCVGGWDPPQEPEHERHGVLRGGDGVAGRSVDDHDPGAGRRLEIDLVGADGGDTDDAQAGSGGPQHLRVDAGLRADDQRVIAAALGEELEQLGAWHAHADVGVVRGSENVDAGLGDRLDHEDAGHAASLAVVGRERRPVNDGQIFERGQLSVG